MAATDKSLEERIAALEKIVLVCDEKSMSDKDKAAAAKTEQEAEADQKDRIEKARAEIEAQRKGDDEARAAQLKKDQEEVEKRNKDNGATPELVDPEPEEMPEPPPFHNDDANEHNDDPKQTYDKDVVELTAATTPHGRALEIHELPDAPPSPEIERLTDAPVEE